MKLKITSTEGVLYEGDVIEVVVPTKEGEVGILPEHATFAGVVKGGICKFKPTEYKENFLKSGDYSVVSVGDGIIYTNGKIVSIIVSSANATIGLSEEELQKMKEKLEKEIEEIKAKGSLEEIEKALFKMNKILADIQIKRKTL